MEVEAPTPGPRATIFGAWRRGFLILGGTLALLALMLVVGRGRRGAPPEAPRSPATVTVAEAALRRAPSVRAETVAALKRGDDVTVISDRGAWLEVRAGGATGYVRAGEIERRDDREAREDRARKILSFPPVYGVVSQDTHVLLAPFPFAPRAGVLPKGTSIAIHAVDHAYFAYADRANGVAFVASADVDLVPPDPKSPDIVPDSSVVSLRRLSTLDVPTPLPTPADVFLPPPPPLEEGVAERAPPPPPPPPRESFGDSIEPAVLVSKVDPEYPESAIRAQVEGSVVLDIEIDEAGRVVDVQVTRGLPFGLSEAAAEAVREWRYRPARGPAGPIPSRKVVRILFALRGGG